MKSGVISVAPFVPNLGADQRETALRSGSALPEANTSHRTDRPRMRQKLMPPPRWKPGRQAAVKFVRRQILQGRVQALPVAHTFQKLANAPTGVRQVAVLGAQREPQGKPWDNAACESFMKPGGESLPSAGPRSSANR